MEHYDPAALCAEYNALESGDVRLRAIRSAVTAAELAGDREALLHFHHDLIKESVFSGDRYQALIDFPQYLAAVKEDPALEREWTWDTLWMFKWILEASTEFYQIEKKQILRWFSEFRRELTVNGYSLKPFYNYRAIFYSYCDRARFRLDYEDFRNTAADSMSDRGAYEDDMIVRFELEIGNRASARKTAQKIFDSGYRSEEIPSATYGYLLEDARLCGDTEYAADCAKKLRPLCEGERFKLQRSGILLCWDAVSDPETGLAFYLRNLHLREGSRNPFLCYWFDRGAARLLQAAADAGLTAAGIPDLRAAAASAAANAQDLAAKFDARNGSDYFTKKLAE